MRLHLLGLFNTIPNLAFSHCAFTGRVRNFGKMLRGYDYEIIEYANEGSEAEATEHVVILETEEFLRLKALYQQEQPGHAAHMDSSIYRTFCAKLSVELLQRVQPGDIVCHPFGQTHAYLDKLLPHARHVEIGIGYEHCYFPLRVYETYSWWHFHLGQEKLKHPEREPGNAYQWVCPMGYDLDEWEPNTGAAGDYLLYFGRIIPLKGMDTIKEIARRTDRPVILCGEGDASPWLDASIPNLTYHPPVTGLARSELLRNAYAMLMPTSYTEPFGGAGVEGMLCGTPLIASDFGCFSETVKHGVTGFRCKTLGDWLAAIDDISTLDRQEIAYRARACYGLSSVGEQFNKIFQQIGDLSGAGWYNPQRTDAIWAPD